LTFLFQTVRQEEGRNVRCGMRHVGLTGGTQQPSGAALVFIVSPPALRPAFRFVFDDVLMLCFVASGLTHHDDQFMTSLQIRFGFHRSPFGLSKSSSYANR
jgi:hypothetical protein